MVTARWSIGQDGQDGRTPWLLFLLTPEQREEAAGRLVLFSNQSLLSGSWVGVGGQVHKDIALFLEIKMDDSVNDKKYNYRQQAQLQKSWVRPTAIQSKSARRKPAGLGNKRQRTSVVLTRHSWTKQIHEIEGGLWTFRFHDILIMRWGTPKEKEENI